MAFSLEVTGLTSAINTMLTSIGEQPIQDADNLGGISDASIAKNILENTSRAVQSRGWIFNTDLDVEYEPNSQTKMIELGNDVLRIDTTNRVRTSEEDVIE